MGRSFYSEIHVVGSGLEYKIQLKLSRRFLPQTYYLQTNLKEVHFRMTKDSFLRLSSQNVVFQSAILKFNEEWQRHFLRH